MVNEEWIIWKSNTEIPDLIDLDSMEYGKKGLILIFSTNNKLIQMSFESSVLSFRITDEGKLLSTFNYVTSNYPKEFLVEGAVFKIRNSNYLKWFQEENYGMFEGFNIEHYLFKTHNDIVEVLSNYPPKITVS